MLEMLFNSTNAKLRSVRQAHRLNIQETSRELMSAFIGLLYLRGLLGMNNHKISKSLVNEPVIGHAVFSATMSKNCFKLLIVALCFDDHTTRPVRGKSCCFFDLQLCESSLNFSTSITGSRHSRSVFSLGQSFMLNANTNWFQAV